jgi:HEPN domain-containing protein
MSPELQDPENPGKWMEFAWNDLRMAEEGEQSGYRLEALCYLAQQSAEKALKALCISLRIPFLKTHSLEKLLALLPPGLVPPSGVQKAKDLTGYAEKGRYPHGYEKVGLKEYRRAVQSARKVVEWADRMIRTQTDPNDLFAKEPPAVYVVHASAPGRKPRGRASRPKRRRKK